MTQEEIDIQGKMQMTVFNEASGTQRKDGAYCKVCKNKYFGMGYNPQIKSVYVVPCECHKTRLADYKAAEAARGRKQYNKGE
jgi:hypothetical protein